MLVLLAWSPGLGAAGPSSGGPPPAAVVTAPVEAGRVEPLSEFVGTIRYTEISRVAAEVPGKVERVTFEEGDRVAKGKIMAVVNTDLLAQMVQVRRAALAQAEVELTQARADLDRSQRLFKRQTLSQQKYEDDLFLTKKLINKVAGLRAELSRLELEIARSVVKAPFNGLILEKKASPGEWLASGTTVAVVARSGAMDVEVDIPQRLLPLVRPGQTVPVKVCDKLLQGRVTAVIPSGEVTTRSFPVKIRLTDGQELAAGMEARVSLPSGRAVDALMAPRAAMIDFRGRSVVFVVAEGRAEPVPVTPVGYQGGRVGLKSPRLKAGDLVVIKGNERLQPGQSVRPAGDAEK